MQINTNLEKQDYIKAYKEMCSFIFKRPLFAAVIVAVALATSFIPFEMFPLKMAGFALTILTTVCLTTLLYRTGSLQGLIDEVRYQQKVFLPAVIAVLALSWLGFIVADILIGMMGQQADMHVQLATPAIAGDLTSSSMLVAVIAGAIVCIAQIMPFVLAYFCNGLNVSKKQGERIWLALMTRTKTFLAFVPMAQLIPIGLMLNIDTTGAMILLAALYSTFLFFIVFNIEPKQAEKSQQFTLVEQA
ncbi:hypothetical protein OPS25_14390 [Alteromonas ponticola]|uniref:Uncharacterized protein n=1 Tax=Alteromonas aquimaris TaxID=2998417 RepID=A0ABT3PC46_9ALTE|nr:hypothetical protein [Alteromonas aquimaris]MCW8109696.1 hypothetical protein [Alteromonas aquimaris]